MSTAQTGKYIYGVIEPDEQRSFGPIGIQGQEVVIVPHRDIGAVISESPVSNFDQLAKEELEACVAAHGRVNELLMKTYDVVPMRFGLITESEAELTNFLDRAYLQLMTTLQHIAGKMEFVVQAFWDEQKQLENLAANDPEIQQLKNEAEKKGKILGMGAKLKLGRHVFEKVDSAKKEYAQAIKQFLGEQAVDSRPGKLIDKQMIMNESFLVARSSELAFDLKMQKLGERYTNTLRLKYIGPFPPYSFTDINLSLGNFDLISQAREILGLVEVATMAEIKKAYHDLAAKYHPDKHFGSTETQEQMKKIAQAYAVLENYCKNYRYSFREEDVNNTLMIR